MMLIIMVLILGCSSQQKNNNDQILDTTASTGLSSDISVSTLENNQSLGSFNIDAPDQFTIKWEQMGESEKKYFINQLNIHMGTSFSFKEVNEDPGKLFSVMSAFQGVVDLENLRNLVPKSDTKDTFELLQEQTTGYSVPDLQFFATNKSDRFLVDFEDIIAGHPLVGANSPRPHNDAQVYFSNTDSRWVSATRPEDYPPIYAVADGYINLPDLGSYNVVDHSDAELPWWHVAYVFTLRIATDEGSNVEFLYQMEPYMIPDLIGKNQDFYKQFIKVKNGQFVKKGDILAYMYVPSLDEMVGNKEASSHIAFSLMKQPSTVLSPSIFSESVVKQFGNIYRNPSEGWESKSFGNDWNRGRGLPDGMGWMINGSQNPFSDNDLNVSMYDGIEDMYLDYRATVKPEDLGFDAEEILYSEFGWGDTVLQEIEIKEDWQLLFAGIGGPMKVTFILERNGKITESQVLEVRPGQNFSLHHKNNFIGDTTEFDISISDPQNWGWSLAFANATADLILPATTRDVEGACPPGCPPSPNPYKLKK